MYVVFKTAGCLSINCKPHTILSVIGSSMYFKSCIFHMLKNVSNIVLIYCMVLKFKIEGL